MSEYAEPTTPDGSQTEEPEREWEARLATNGSWAVGPRGFEDKDEAVLWVAPHHPDGKRAAYAELQRLSGEAPAGFEVELRWEGKTLLSIGVGSEYDFDEEEDA